MSTYRLSRLSYDQEWCWDAMAYGPYLSSSRLSFRIAGEGSPDPERLSRVLRETWSAHPVLRSRFFMDRELPVQRPADLADIDEPRRASGRHTWGIASGSVESPHFVAHPLFRAQLESGPGEWSLRVDASPLIFDVPSVGLWVAEMGRRWTGWASEPAAGDLTTYIIRERIAARAVGAARSAVIESLTGARRYRPMPATGEPPAPGRQVLAQCRAAVPGVPAGHLPDDIGVTAALAAVIFRLTGLPDACFAVRLDSRPAESQLAVGPLSRLVPVRPVLAPGMCHTDMTAAITSALAAAERARDVPLQDALLAVPADGEVDDGPLLPVVLSLAPLPAEPLRMCDSEVSVSWNHELPLNELAISYGRRGADLILWAAYDPQVYERFYIEQFLGALRRVLLEWSRDPDRPLADLRFAELAEVTSEAASGPAVVRSPAATQTALAWCRRLQSLRLAKGAVVAVTCDGTAESAEVIIGCLRAGLIAAPLEHQDPARQRAGLARAAGADLLVERQEDGQLGISRLALASGGGGEAPATGGLRLCVRTLPVPVFSDVPEHLVTVLAERLRAMLNLRRGEVIRLQGARASLWAVAHLLAAVQAGGRIEWADADSRPCFQDAGLAPQDAELAGRVPARAVIIDPAGEGARAVSVSLASPEGIQGLAGTGAAVVVESLIAPEGLAVVRAVTQHSPHPGGIRPADFVYGSVCVLDDSSRPLPDGAEGLVHVVIPRQAGAAAHTVDLGLVGHVNSHGHLVITEQAGGRTEIGGRVLCLTELEETLAGIPEVALAAAAVLHGSAGAAVAALVELTENSALSAETLWSALLRRAPASVLPDRIEVDRGGTLRKLLAAEGTRRRRTRRITDHLATVLDTPYVAPAQGLEERVARTVIAPCLPGVSRIGRYDNFFRLGGSSLGIVKMVTLAEQEFGVLLNATFLFQEPRLVEISALIDRQLAAADSAREVLKSIEHMSDGEVGEVLRMLHDGDRT